MSILSKHIAFVNEQALVQERLAERYAKDEKRQARHLATKERLQELAGDLVLADQSLDAYSVTESPSVQAPALTLRADDLDGLPQELLNELSEGAIPDKSESALLKVIEEKGGIASLDVILVGLYRQTGEVLKRTTLTSKLYRMTQKGNLFPVPSKKGVYSTRKLTEEETVRLFGGDQATQTQIELA
jgi:hypothetical protein